METKLLGRGIPVIPESVRAVRAEKPIFAGYM